MEYASELGTTPLLPADIKLRAQARSMLAWQHSGLSSICSRLSFECCFYPERRALSVQEVEESARLFSMWETALRRSQGPYLVAPLSLADLAFVPTGLRIFSHNPELDSWPLTREWADHLVARAAVQEWMAEARTLPVVQLDSYVQP